MFNHVERDIKEYVKTKKCRRKTLMKHFDTLKSISFEGPLHLCCDNCAGHCECKSDECEGYTKYPSVNSVEDS